METDNTKHTVRMRMNLKLNRRVAILLPLLNLDYLLADSGDGLDDRVAHRDDSPSRQAAQSATSLISQQLDTPQCRPRKMQAHFCQRREC